MNKMELFLEQLSSIHFNIIHHGSGHNKQNKLDLNHVEGAFSKQRCPVKQVMTRGVIRQIDSETRSDDNQLFNTEYIRNSECFSRKEIRLDQALCRYRTKASIDWEIRFVLVLFTKHPRFNTCEIEKMDSNNQCCI